MLGRVVRDYLALVKQPQAPEQELDAESPLLERMLRNSEKLVDTNAGKRGQDLSECGVWEFMGGVRMPHPPSAVR